MLTITLRDQTHVAENPTLHEATVLCSLFLPGDTEEERLDAVLRSLEGETLLDIDLENPKELTRATAILSIRLQSPSTKASICSILRSMFPSIPTSLVDYHLLEHKGKPEHSFTYKLEDLELLEGIILPVMRHFSPEEPKPEATNGQGFTPRKRRAKKTTATALKMS